MMRVFRRRQTQQRLQKPLNMSRGEKIVAARNERDFLKRVIRYDRNVITRRLVLSREHDIADQFWMRDLMTRFAIRSFSLFVESKDL